MSCIDKEKKKRHQLLVFMAIAALAFISGCADPPDDVYIPDDDVPVVLDERHSVWRNLKIYSIFHYRLPDTIGSMTPYDMFDRISDTLRGARYTEYMSDRPTGDTLFDPNTVFYDPEEVTPSTVYFCLPEFSDTALVVFNRILPILAEYQNIIIDVRDNGGGYLSVSDAILGEMLPYGTPYVNVRYRDYNARIDAGETLEDVFSTETRRPKLLNKKIAVLINGYSASASEILAAGLKDRAGAYLVGGSNSYGKGMGQLLIPITTPERVKKLSVTFLELSGLSERTGKYHRVGIWPDQVPADVETDVNEHVPNVNQQEIIQAQIEDIQAEYPNVSAEYIRRILVRELREIYYAMKMLQPDYAFPEDGEDGDSVVVGMAKRRSADIGEIAAKIYRARERAKARWRPIGAVIADENDLPGGKLFGGK
ncbi:MAG: hypothetical protein LBC59_08190 [Chitinispirillales bacterium]|jgi:hypothetical protein|nr:hypothetical protein [Chitinispirillales bacterium]